MLTGLNIATTLLASAIGAKTDLERGICSNTPLCRAFLEILVPINHDIAWPIKFAAISVISDLATGGVLGGLYALSIAEFSGGKRKEQSEVLMIKHLNATLM